MDIDLSKIDLRKIDMTQDERFSRSLVPRIKNIDVRDRLKSPEDIKKEKNLNPAFSYYRYDNSTTWSTTESLITYTATTDFVDTLNLYSNTSTYLTPSLYDRSLDIRQAVQISSSFDDDTFYINYNSSLNMMKLYIYKTYQSESDDSILENLRKLSVYESNINEHTKGDWNFRISYDDISHYPTKSPFEMKKTKNRIRIPLQSRDEFEDRCRKAYLSILDKKERDYQKELRGYFIWNKRDSKTEDFKRMLYRTDAGRFDQIEYNYEMAQEEQRVMELLGIK